MTASTIKQQRALQVLAVAALATIVWIAHPVGVGLFLGVLSAFAVEPVYTRMRAAHWTPRVAAIVCVFATVTVVTATCTVFAIVFVTRGVALARSLPANALCHRRRRYVSLRIVGSLPFTSIQHLLSSFTSKPKPSRSSRAPPGSPQGARRRDIEWAIDVALHVFSYVLRA